MLPVLSRRAPRRRRRVLGQEARGYQGKNRTDVRPVGGRLRFRRDGLLRADRFRLSDLGVLERFELGGGGVERDVVPVGGESAVAERRRSLARVRGALRRLARLRLERRALLDGQEAVYAIGELRIEAFHLGDFVDPRGADAAQRPEMSEESALPLLADAGDLFQDAAEVPLAAQLAVVVDGEAVRLVAQAREQEQLAGVLAEDHRVLLSRKEHTLGASLDAVLHESALAPRTTRGGRGRRRVRGRIP